MEERERETEREEGKRHSTNDVIMEKIEPEALSLSLPLLFGFASHPNRRSFRGALQVEQALDSNRWIPLDSNGWNDLKGGGFRGQNSCSF